MSKTIMALGGAVAVIGISYAVYHHMQSSTSSAITTPPNVGGANVGNQTHVDTPPKTGSATPVTPVVAGSNTITPPTSYVNESFPLKPGMKGPNVKSLQTALKVQFNNQAIATDGYYGKQTFEGLRDIGYVSIKNLSLSKDDFNAVIAGIRKGF